MSALTVSITVLGLVSLLLSACIATSGAAQPVPTATAFTAPAPQPSVIAQVMPAPSASSAAVMVHTFRFSPETLAVISGATVTWTNHDAIEHSITHGTEAAPGSAFDSGLFTQGQQFSFAFTTAGEYAYFCTRHPSMTGQITVAAGR